MIEIENLYKIYGDTPQKAMDLLEKGLNKKEIRKKTGDVVGLKDVSLQIKDDELFVIMGLSGSGKSTLIRCINRLVEPTSGKIYINRDPDEINNIEKNEESKIDITSFNKKEMREIRRNRISMVFQESALLPHLSVKENILFGPKLKGELKSNREEIEKKADEIIDMIGLEGWEEASPDELSGGMKQRVGLGRALIVGADVLLMDEPFSGLDPLIKREMQMWLLDLLSEIEKTVIFITHDMKEAFTIGERIGVMKEGTIIQVGEKEDILENPADEYVEDFVKDIKSLLKGEL